MTKLDELTHLKRQPLEVEVYDFLVEQEIPLLPYRYATTKDQMEDIANESSDDKYVCKVMSPKILHKSDFKAVLLGIEPDELVDTFVKLEEQFSSLDFQGILVVPQASSGVEFLIGSNTDPTFGIVTVFGVGGTMVEIIKDVTFAKAPVSLAEARLMIDDIKSQELFEGPRGLPSTDKIELAELIVKISKISIDYQELIREIDLNPIRVTDKGIYPLDARLIFHSEKT